MENRSAASVERLLIQWRAGEGIPSGLARLTGVWSGRFSHSSFPMGFVNCGSSERHHDNILSYIGQYIVAFCEPRENELSSASVF